MQEDAKDVWLEELGNVEKRDVEITRGKPSEERSEFEGDDRERETLCRELLLEKARQHAA